MKAGYTMKFLLYAFVILFTQLSQHKVSGQVSEVAGKSQFILQAIEQYHYQPRLIDDAFSAFLFDAFILSLDERKLIFSTNDLEQLDKFRYELDNYINNKDYSFISEIASLYDKRIREINLFLNAQQNREYNYGLSESIEFYPNRGYLNPNALAARYKKLIKYKVLSLYLQQADSLTSKAAVDSKKLEALKEEAIEWELCWIQNKLGQDNSAAQYVEAWFLKALSNTFDPHTLYLSRSETDFFNQSLSDESLSFGMELYRNNRGELVIESLIPGGPAWHSNQFNEGDIIRSIRSDRDSTVELKCIPTKEAVDIIYSDQIRKAVFTIQKMNGEQVESYNKAVAEFNEEIKKYNETNEFTNKKRAKTIEYWNQEVEKFFERNTN